MEKTNKKIKKILFTVACAVLVAGLAVSIGFNIYQAFYSFDTYLQSTDEIYIMESGILNNNLKFADGEDVEFKYDFSNAEYAALLQKYKYDKVAGSGTEFERALNLMDEYAPRLTHLSYYDNHIEIKASALLEYSLDNKSHGINCRNKAQILNEMCLSLGIYARKVWIMPNSGYDNDCHVVNEVWDSTLNKWVMLDITNNEYWVDESGTPLSILEIRYKAAKQEFCTPVSPKDKLRNLQKSKSKNIGDFLYIVKNLTYMEYMTDYGVGESENFYLLFPENLKTSYKFLIDKSAVEKTPLK